MKKKITLLILALVLMLGQVSQATYGTRQWNLSIVDTDLGDIVAGGNFTITVYQAGQTSAGTIYSDDAATGKTNPVTPGSDAVSAVGRLKFYCAYTTIDVKITSSVYGGSYKYLSVPITTKRLVYPVRTDMGYAITGTAGEDFTVTNTGGSIVLTSTEAVQDSIHLKTATGAVKIEATTSIIDDGALLLVTGMVDTGNELWGGIYADINIGDGTNADTTDGPVYAVSGILWPQNAAAPASIIGGAKFGINETSADLSGATVCGIVIENILGAAGGDPLNQYMMYFNCLSTGETPDNWFYSTGKEAIAFEESIIHTSASASKIGSIKIGIGGYGDCYLYVYDHAGE